MNTYDNFLLDLRANGVLVVTFDKPGKRNALTHEAADELKAICREVNSDARVKVLVFTGAGEVFSAGADLPNLKFMSGKPAAELLDWYPANIQQLPELLVHLRVPTIAAVNGPAIGIGFDLCCMFDLRVASDTAKFAESFIGIGLIPGDGGAWLARQACGYAVACEMAFTGDPISAERALQVGLVNQVVPQAQTLDAALQLADRMAQRPAAALRMTKSLMVAARMQGLRDVLQLSAALQVTAHASEEHHALIDGAIASLAAKRAAKAPA